MTVRVFAGLVVAALLLAFAVSFGLVASQGPGSVNKNLQVYGSR